MKKQTTKNQLLQNFAVALFFAFAFLFSTQNAVAQFSNPCPVNAIPFTQQMGFGSTNKMILGGYGQNDGSICWNCYSDSSFYGRARAFNMPTGSYVAGSPTPDWSSRISQDIVSKVFRIQTGRNSTCYDSLQWNGGISVLLNGNVGIGTDYTFGYKFAVNGSIIAKNEIRATLTGVSWPDYVFDSTYQLKPLLLLEREIDSLGHLSEIPSAAEVEETGLSLTGISIQLVKKVEELTLYTIAQQKEIDELKLQNEELIKAVNRLLEEKK